QQLFFEPSAGQPAERRARSDGAHADAAGRTVNVSLRKKTAEAGSFRAAPRRSAHEQSTVHREIGACGIAAFFRSDPRDDGRDFFGATQTLDGHGRDDLV